MTRRLDLTLEHLRLGALHGLVRDADGSILVNLFTAFNVTEPDAVEFSDSAGTLRASCMHVKRQVEKAAKSLPSAFRRSARALLPCLLR